MKKKKTKKIISIIALIVGIALIIMAIFHKELFVRENDKTKNKSELKFDKNVGYIPEDNPDNDHLLITDFKTEDTENGIKVSFTKYNNGSEEIKNKSIYINVYNGNKLLMSYPHEFDTLKVGEEVKVEETLSVILEKDDKITDYQLIYNGYQLKILDAKEYAKEKQNKEE